MKYSKQGGGARLLTCSDVEFATTLGSGENVAADGRRLAIFNLYQVPLA